MGSFILPIPFAVVDTALGDGEGAGLSSGASALIVEVEEDLPKVLARGARWVSLSSVKKFNKRKEISKFNNT